MAIFSTFLHFLKHGGFFHFHSKKSETCSKDCFWLDLSFDEFIKFLKQPMLRKVTIYMGDFAFFGVFCKNWKFYRWTVKVGGFCEKFVKCFKNLRKCISTHSAHESRFFQKFSKKVKKYVRWNFIIFTK